MTANPTNGTPRLEILFARREEISEIAARHGASNVRVCLGRWRAARQDPRATSTCLSTSRQLGAS
jgi:hypothetical protein